KEIENVRLSWIRAVKSHNWSYIDRAMEGVYLFYNTYGWAIEGEAVFNVAVEAFQPLFAADSHLADAHKLTFARLLIRHNSFLINMYQKDRPRQQMELARPLIEALAPAHERARLIIHDSMIAPPDRHEALLDELVALCAELRKSGDEWTLSQALTHLSIHRDSLFEHRYAEEAGEIARRIGNRRVLVELLDAMGTKAQMLGDYPTAREKFLEGLAISRQVNYRWGLALSLDYAGYACRLMGDYDDARRLHEESLQVSREIDDRLGIAGSLDNLGLVSLDLGQYDQAAEYFRSGLAIREQVNDVYSIQVSVENLAFAHLGLGELEEASENFTRSLALAEEIGFHWGWIRTLGGMISLSTRRADIAAAVRLSRQLDEFIRETAVHLQSTSITLLLFVLSEIFLARGEPEKAIPLLQTTIRRRETWAGMRQKAERLLADARAAAGVGGLDSTSPDEPISTQACLDRIRAALDTLA
ncbi:MAG TPA: tetratricopeptide repeat protein, partial [Anaerolineaceae bacterium]|nr:tetratricopeptide repeat protein [Anaerolineaceae bacterium]